MNFEIVSMTQENAQIIADQWKYEGIYSFYDLSADPEDYQEFVNPDLRGERYFEVYGDGRLAGFFVVEPGENREIELGFGLKPELCGKGLGKDFLSAIESYVMNHYDCKTMVLWVAAFNKRAIRLYQKCGYIQTAEEERQSNGDTYRFLCMKKNPVSLQSHF